MRNFATWGEGKVKISSPLFLNGGKGMNFTKQKAKNQSTAEKERIRLLLLAEKKRKEEMKKMGKKK